MKVSRTEVYSKGGHILKPGDFVVVKYATVIGHGDDFAVYMSLNDWLDEDVVMHGDKVSEEVGRAVAPYCAHPRYRS